MGNSVAALGQAQLKGNYNMLTVYSLASKNTVHLETSEVKARHRLIHQIPSLLPPHRLAPNIPTFNAPNVIAHIKYFLYIHDLVP